MRRPIVALQQVYRLQPEMRCECIRKNVRGVLKAVPEPRDSILFLHRLSGARVWSSGVIEVDVYVTKFLERRKR